MPFFATRLALIIETLRAAVVAFAAAAIRADIPVWLGTQAYLPILPPPRHPPLPADTWTLLHARLGRLAGRLATLIARWRAGTLPPPRPARSSPARPRPSRPYPRLPAQRGWINARIPAAAPCAGNLHALMADPELPCFLAEVPRAGRLLRPLCHALAVDLPSWLRRAPRRPAAPHPPPASAPHPTDHPPDPPRRNSGP